MELPKWEMMQHVKTVLVRHGVDLTLMQFTVSKSTIFLDGLLRKDPSGDFTAGQLVAMLKELDTLPSGKTVQAEFSNWDVKPAFGEWNVWPRRVVLGDGPTPRE